MTPFLQVENRPLQKSKFFLLFLPPVQKQVEQQTTASRKKRIQSWLLLMTILLSLGSFGQTVKVISFITNSPAISNINQYVASPNFLPTLLLTGTTATNSRFVSVRGSIECLSPIPFKITVGKLVDSLPILLMPNVPVQLSSPTQKQSTFNYFRFNDLTFSGNIDPKTLLNDPSNPNDPSNFIDLPDGTYRACFTFTDISSNKDITDPASLCGTFTVRCNPPDGVNITTTIPLFSPNGLNPVIGQAISSGTFSTAVSFTNLISGCIKPVAIFGKIERLSPSPFTIITKPGYFPSSILFWGQPRTLTAAEQLDALGRLSEDNLSFTGINPAALRDPTNPSALRLPDGNYRICFSARYLRSSGGVGREASNPNLGCAMFTICTTPISAPQLTQPVNSVSISTSSVQTITPTSPVVFTWTPPQAICGAPRGGFNYELEIRELLDNQTVVDAINNPFVFEKDKLPSTTFVLDTNLYRNVLQLGKRYAVRVRAYTASPLDTFTIANNGYSRVEAFQYGSNPDVVVRPVIPIVIQQPENYYIPFGERKTNNWDDRYTAYKNDPKRDTVIPLQEFIALNLIQNGIAYNLDAIELFMALNPQLANLRQLRLSTPARLPEFPVIPPIEQQKFNDQYNRSLQPDPAETVRFRRYLDSLQTLQLQGQDSSGIMIGDFLAALNGFSKNMESLNHVSANLINNLLSELVYDLRQKNIDNNHMQEVIANIRDLMTNNVNTTSFLLPQGKGTLTRFSTPLYVSLAGTVAMKGKGEAPLPTEGPLLPLDVVVWRGSTEPPARPISNAPELKGLYRIFYTTPPLYNHRNPEINANSLPDLASTARVSLPKLAQFKFWTLNMVNHKMTRAVDVETSDVFLLNNKKRWGSDKKIYVILKVE
jgi:hypothetical protein